MKINKGKVDPFEAAAEVTLDDLARQYAKLDAEEKAAKKAKEDLRGPFFALMTQRVLEDHRPQQEVIDISKTDVERFNNDPRAYALFYYPTYTVENIAFDGEVWKLLIQENPELLPTSFEVDGLQLGRSVSLVGAEFKVAEFDEWLNSLEAEDLFSEKTLDALACCVTESVETVYSFNEERAHALIADSPETIAVFQRFSYAGKPQVKFLPVTKAKAEQKADGQTG